MGNFNGFRGTTNGAIQTNYTDQPGLGTPGELAFASEAAVAGADAIIIGGSTGIMAGKGVIYTQNTIATTDLQQPNVVAVLPSTGKTVTDFQGILLFDATMQSDSNGVPGYNPGRVGRILRKGRTGGRVYVKCMDTITTPMTDSVYLCTVASTDGAYQPGDFTNQNSAAGGTFTDVSTVARWVTTATGTVTIPDIAVLELF